MHGRCRRPQPDVDAFGGERGIGAAGEHNNFIVASIDDGGKDDGTEAAASSGNCNFDHIQHSR